MLFCGCELVTKEPWYQELVSVDCGDGWSTMSTFEGIILGNRSLRNRLDLLEKTLNLKYIPETTQPSIPEHYTKIK